MNSWIEIRPIPELKGGSRREAEGAAWRAIVRERLGGDTAITYNENGAPVLEKGRGYIGVSHTKGWVAVVWSPEPCAIDIELAGRKLSPAAASRVGISPPSQGGVPEGRGGSSLLSEWCAYEATYKYKGLTGVEPPPNAVRFPPHPVLTVAVICSE